MPTITTKDGTGVYYKDWGSGQPVVFSHGWPLNADAWDDQAFFVASNGYRAIAHDRRGAAADAQDRRQPRRHGLANTTAYKDTLNKDLLAFIS